MVERHLYNYLQANPTVFAAISDRIYPQFVPEGAALPAVAYSRITDPTELKLDGPSSNRSPRFQISIIARTQNQANNIAEVIRGHINLWKQVYDDIQVESAFAESGIYLSLDYYTPPNYGIMMEAFIYWKPV